MKTRKQPKLPVVITLKEFRHLGKSVRRAQMFTVEFLPEGGVFTVRLWHLTSFYVLRLSLNRFADLQDHEFLQVVGEAPKPRRITTPSSEQFKAIQAREDAIIARALKRKK